MLQLLHHLCSNWKRQGKVDASKYSDALLKAYDLALSMHRELGNELPNVGWDVMVRQSGPVFLEFKTATRCFSLALPSEVQKKKYFLNIFWQKIVEFGHPSTLTHVCARTEADSSSSTRKCQVRPGNTHTHTHTHGT
jgi:hypothetical protein